MTPPGDASGESSDHPKTDAQIPARHRQQKSDFDIDVFLGTQNHTADDDHLDGSGWRRKLSSPSMRRSLGDFAFGVTTVLLKRMSGAALMVFIVVLVVFGPNAPWDQLTWNILRGGADEASMAQCDEIGEWFSLFDQHTDRIYRLLDESGSPDAWDTVTLTKVAELLPMYMDDWLAEMQKNEPPPAGRRLDDLFISFLKNYGGYVLAIQEGDLKAQKYFERENSIISTAIDIENRYIMNLCI